MAQYNSLRKSPSNQKSVTSLQHTISNSQINLLPVLQQQRMHKADGTIQIN